MTDVRMVPGRSVSRAARLRPGRATKTWKRTAIFVGMLLAAPCSHFACSSPGLDFGGLSGDGVAPVGSTGGEEGVGADDLQLESCERVMWTCRSGELGTSLSNTRRARSGKPLLDSDDGSMGGASGWGEMGSGGGAGGAGGASVSAGQAWHVSARVGACGLAAKEPAALVFSRPDAPYTIYAGSEPCVRSEIVVDGALGPDGRGQVDLRNLSQPYITVELEVSARECAFVSLDAPLVSPSRESYSEACELFDDSRFWDR